MFSQVGPGLVSFLIYFLYKIMCVRYLISIWEKDFIGFWSWRFISLGEVHKLLYVWCPLFLP